MEEPLFHVCFRGMETGSVMNRKLAFFDTPASLFMVCKDGYV